MALSQSSSGICPPGRVTSSVSGGAPPRRAGGAGGTAATGGFAGTGGGTATGAGAGAALGAGGLTASGASGAGAACTGGGGAASWSPPCGAGAAAGTGATTDTGGPSQEITRAQSRAEQINCMHRDQADISTRPDKRWSPHRVEAAEVVLIPKFCLVFRCSSTDPLRWTLALTVSLSVSSERQIQEDRPG